MNELDNIIEQATAHITYEYFQLEIDGGTPKYRERVYCYELYHQMRLRWPLATEYRLNGEVDKASHPILRKLGADMCKPDLLVHTPGSMFGNHAVVEVKSVRAAPNTILKDLTNLSKFKNKVNYKRALYLIYGHNSRTLISSVLLVSKQISDLPEIELWVHDEVSKPANFVGFISNLDCKDGK